MAKPSKLFQHMLGGRDLIITRRFDVQFLNHAIIDDHGETLAACAQAEAAAVHFQSHGLGEVAIAVGEHRNLAFGVIRLRPCAQDKNVIDGGTGDFVNTLRSEEHTSELQSLMRISYAVFCLKKKTNKQKQ